ncbi:hypothetical protein B0T14DRAFT_566490 [Immersiella caudata]|uniref:Zn(2)-C6 fungal-type domain-containing protein n=1 Tax=Immersiella caudata TaxID=314043 RepID=A0AA39WQD0_9PEZI|nr:hypothetical protein B0T14DRAFT_566490 [Immersiella caudata]
MAPQPSFRSIQPALAILADPVAQKRDRPVAWSEGSSLDKRSKRFKSVTQACNICRRHKAKCDGARPRCGGCASKGKPCGYEGEAGQSRQAAIKARLEALEKLLIALQSKPHEEAQRMLQHIRSADDIVSLSGQVGDAAYNFNAALGDGITSGSVSCPSSASRGSSPFTVGHGDLPPVLRPPDSTIRDPDSLIRFIMPNEDAIRAAVRNFYACSGGLFHAFPQRQVEEYCNRIFDNGHRLDVSQRVAICCVCCVAAVGVQYYPTDVTLNVDRGSAALLYDISRHYFANILEEQPLEAIKVCAILAMYNIFEKATAGLAYVEAGMGMAQRFGTPGSPCQAFLTETQCEEFRIAWRMLLFLSSWLSSTLGYVSESDETSFQTIVPEAGLEHDHNTPIGEIAQSEMTKISLLKAGVLRSHLALKVFSSDALDSAFQALQTWHETLPPQLLLANLARTDMSEQDRRTLFYVHLLYLGAIILVYRRAISQVVQDSRVGGDTYLSPTTTDISQKSLVRTLLSQADKGMFAARYTARILGLLLANRSIVQRCWLIIFQAHTSCVVILHSIAQKQLHNFPPATWSDDLEHAQLCLDTLKYCGTIDAVALRFYAFLSDVHSKLANFGWRRGMNGHAEVDGSNQWASVPPDLALGSGPTDINPIAPADYLISTPPGCDPGLQKLSFTLLSAVCRPWDDPSETRPGQKSKLHDTSRSETCSVDSQLMKSEWDFEDKSSFRWDTEAMGMKSGERVPECCFIGSEVPNGWSPLGTVDIEVDDGASTPAT